MNKRTLIVWIGAIALALVLLAWAFRPQAVSIEVAEVEKGLFEQTIDDDGKTRVRDRYVVAAPLAGRVQRIVHKAGDTLEQGALVAVIMPLQPVLQDDRTARELEERLGAAQANVKRAAAMEERASAALDQSRADSERSKKLAFGGFVSAAGLEQAELAVRLKERELEAARFERLAHEREAAQARAALLRAGKVAKPAPGTLAGFEVFSPVSGRVLKVVQESEGPVSLGAPLIEIGDTRNLEVVVDVLSTEAVNIPGGAPVYLDAGGDKIEGRVRLIEPSAFTKVSALGVEEQRVNVIVDLVSPPKTWQMLGDGYRVDARIVVHRARAAVLVPAGALFRDGASFAVFVVDGAIARSRRLEVTRRNERFGLVSKGLDGGETVVVFPGDVVRDGSRVEPRNAPR